MSESPWLIGVKDIAEYAQYGTTVVNTALLAGELEGRRRTVHSQWRSKREWVDQWIDNFPSVAAS